MALKLSRVLDSFNFFFLAFVVVIAAAHCAALRLFSILAQCVWAYVRLYACGSQYVCMSAK